jgi:alpha-galactosidase
MTNRLSRHRMFHHRLISCLAVCGLIFGGACSQAQPDKQSAPAAKSQTKAQAPVQRPAPPSPPGVDWFAAQPPTGAIWVETLDLAAVTQGWGSPKAAQSVEDHPITINGHVYPHGLGTHANSELTVDLKGAAEWFHAVGGIDDEVKDKGSVVFTVWVDGKEVKRSDTIRGGQAPCAFSIDLRGARELTLIIEDAGDGIDYDHADWAAAMLMLKPGAAPGAPGPVAVAPPPEPAPKIASGTPPEPAIHAPRVTGSTPGRPFLFRIPATGEPPLHFSAKNLPAGLTLDANTGIITGSLASEDTTDVEITVNGPRGKATSVLTISGGEHQLALTPPMGWNSWNVWGTSVDDAKVRAAADWLEKSGLAAHGYQYINIDDAWEGARDADGRIQTNEKFPDMKALADYVHSKGLKLGIYSSPGPKTCAGYEGSYEHEQQDAKSYAAWGIDYLKYDWCSYEQVVKSQRQGDKDSPKTLDELQKPYHLMRAALDACDRDIVYSLCQYGMGDVWEWGAIVGGNLWRTTGDITDTWASMSSIGFGQNGHESCATPGAWNDPDMLIVGKVGWGPEIRNTNLTPNEQITHLTLWSLLSSPLLIGCDLSQLDEFTLAVLTNPEVIEVNQDPLGLQAARVAEVPAERTEVWARSMADGTMAVGLFNRGRRETTVTVKWDDIGLEGSQPVRNLWLRQDEGVFDGSYSAKVPRHGAVLLRVGQAVPESLAAD